MHIVRMSSEEYGTEEYRRHTLKEARKTKAALKKSIRTIKDKVKRKIEIVAL